MKTITAKDVAELRQRTGAGMMDCKKALEENEGHLDKSVDFLRKKGIAKAEKRADRSASEGIVAAEVTNGGATGAMVEVNCETDFVARNDEFKALARTLLDQALRAPAGTTEQFLASSKDGKTVDEIVKEASGKTGEAVRLTRVARFDAPQGVVGRYVHFNGKLGVLVEVEAENGAKHDELTTLANTVAEHVAGAPTSPLAVDKSGVPADVVERERAIYEEQTRASGKPDNMIDKIVTGKVEAYFKQVALVQQPWVREEKQTIGDLVNAAAKSVGAPVRIVRFARFKLGEQ